MFFYVFNIFSSSNIETEMLILCTWRRFQKSQKMSSVEHQNAQKLEFLQKPPVELIFKTWEFGLWMKMLILCTWRRFQKIQKMCQLDTKMIEKEWIGRDSGPDGSQNPKKWASKTHTSLLSKSFRHKISIFSSSVFALRDILYF